MKPFILFCLLFIRGCSPVFAIEQLAPPPVSVTLPWEKFQTLRKDTDDIIARESAESAEVADLLKQLGIVKTEDASAEQGEKVLQGVIDIKNAKIVSLTLDDAKQTRLKWKWFFAWLGTVLLVVGFFVARQYIPFLKLL